MKLKNSYVLLMAMAIFLLISIGSVSASDDVAADSDVLASADESVVLTNDIEEVDENIVASEETPEKTNTTVTATSDKDKFGYDEDKNITVTVKDSASSEITGLNETNFNITEGKNPIKFSYNNTNITILDKLAVGTHNLTISYLGNATYNPNVTNVILKIFGNKTLEDVPTVVDAVNNQVTIPFRLTDGIDNITDIDSSKFNITDGKNVLEWSINRNVITVMNITVVPTTLTINYTENGSSSIKKVEVKYKTIINVNSTSLDIDEGKNATITVKVYDANNNPINITDKNLTISTGKFSYNATTGELNITGLKKGVNNITITYKGNAVNNTSKANVLINVHGATEINTNGTKINVNSTKEGEVQIINITDGVVTFDFNKTNISINVTYKEGNATKIIEVAEWEIINGTIKFTLENGNFTTATLTIKYNETTVKNITLNRIFNAKIIAVTTVNEYKDGNFTFKLVDIDDNDNPLVGKSVPLYTTGNIRAGFSATTDANGIASFKNANLYTFDQTSTSLTMKPFEVGNYTVDIQTTGSINATKLTTNLTVTKATIKIEIAPYNEYYGSNKNVTIKVTNVNSGLAVPGIILKLYMPQTSGQTYYVQTDSNGTDRISAKNLVGGDYQLTVSNNDTKNINNASNSSTVVVKKIPVTVTAKDATIDFNTGTTSTITVKKDGKALSGMYLLVRVYETSKKYNDYLFQTNSKGQVAFSASLAVGKHKIVINSADSRYDTKQVTQTITVKKASAKITAKKVTDYYKGAKYFTVKLTNTKNNKPIYDAKVNIKVFVSKNRYYNYEGNTGANGQIRLSLDNLKPGSYKVIVSGASPKNYKADPVTTKIVIKKAPTKLTPKKITAKKGAKKYFQVKVTNKKTKKVIKGVKLKIKVYTGKKAKTYTAKTNSKGIAKISTAKLKVGSHKVVVKSANKYCVAKKAKSTIKIKK